MAPVPASILRALSLPDASKASLSTANLGSGFTSTGVIRATVPTADGAGEKERRYFVKTSADGQAAEEMFRGEYESLNAIADSVPGFCPRALAWGPLEAQDSKGKSKGFFLATEFLELGAAVGQVALYACARGSRDGQAAVRFPVATFCGDTKQPNRWRDSWAEFYAQERLLTVLETSEKRNGKDAGLREMVERTVGSVVPALLGDGHLGMIGRGRGRDHAGGGAWGSVEWECGPGRIVGSGRKEDEGVARWYVWGFGSAFFEAYHRIVPKTEPVEEYEDRVRLYELYHHLNHHAIFGAGYRSGAVSIMQKLLKKYGDS
ncbi:putative fructosamine-3-kinase [Aspergillus novofumigatus IBT 16806]|uniref:protein-ribulosamine 3-kinase n=1 Tax=Aspergillus novofumigatus (strain IBT 16806) TaxID=1392255 RepID=A0A2I1CAB6_ASPN1|nr:uncharacterized protein P174DRAFT_451437 [Aspergillus novofumigatus IBT 16806]PKX94573.1 hypothetical protein P174DRAFT_451437 [Aspergillus novofumigatus IBT 16806]